MSHPVFFEPSLTPTLAEVVTWSSARTLQGADLTQIIRGIAVLEEGEPGDLTFLDNPKYLDHLAQTRASACLVSETYASRVPASTVALITAEPYRAFGLVLAHLFPDALRPTSVCP